MRPAEDMENLFEQAQAKSTDKVDSKILAGALRDLEKRSETGPGPARQNIWRIIKNRYVQLAAAVIIIAAILMGINSLVGSDETIDQKPIAGKDKQAKSSYLYSTVVPGPNEVCLNTNLLGQRRILQVPDHGWIKIGKGLFIDLWQYTTEGKYVDVIQKGAFIYISVDDGPLQLVGVRLQRRDDLEFLRAALLESDSPLTLWCDIQPPMEISDLPNLEKITSFQQVNPKLLSDLSPLAHLANLESIYIKHRYQYYPQVIDLSSLSSLKNLEVLILSECHNLSSISGLGRNLTHLELSGAINLTDLTGLAKLTKLTYLVLSNSHRITNLSPLAGLENLSHLDLHYCYNISDLSPLTNLTNLTFLDLRGCSKITDTDFSVVESLTNLKHLEIGDTRSDLSDLSPLADLVNLSYLKLLYCHQITNLSPLGNLHNLRYLDLCDCDQISDLSPLANLTNLRHVNLLQCKSISNILPLANLTNLSQLVLSGCPSISDLSPLSKLNNLTWIELAGCDGITDLSPLQAAIAQGANVAVDQRLQPQLEQLRMHTP